MEYPSPVTTKMSVEFVTELLLTKTYVYTQVANLPIEFISKIKLSTLVKYSKLMV